MRSGWSTWKFSSSQARPYTVILAMTVKAYLWGQHLRAMQKDEQSSRHGGEKRLRELGLFSLEKAARGPNKCL